MCSVRRGPADPVGASRLHHMPYSNTEQWICNTDSRVNLPSCELDDLGSIPDTVVDEIKECMLLEGIQNGTAMRVGAGVQDDVTSTTCVLSTARRRFGVDAPKGTGFAVDPLRQAGYNKDTTQPLFQQDYKVIPHSTPLTLKWLSENFECAEGVCIPRNVIYRHYYDFCKDNGMIPVNPASFGKIIRQMFKMVKNRRLGTRGSSTYHYYGIGIRNSSVYYEEQYSRNGLNNSTQGKRGVNNHLQISPGSSTNPTSPRANVPSTTAPALEFPNLQDVSLPLGVPQELYRSFFMMYRAHCLRIFNSICMNEIDEVKEFLEHFWKEVPPHFTGILRSNAVVNMVGVCDSILYRSIAGLFVPSTHKTSPALLTILKKLVPLIDGWFYDMLSSLPVNLCAIKRNLAHNFCRVLRRLISLNQIWLPLALMLQNRESMSKMLSDWRGTNVEEICSDVAFGIKRPEFRDVMLSLFKEFEDILERQVCLDNLVQWLEMVVDRCVVTAVRKHGCPLRRVAHHFLLIWVTVGTRVLRDMTIFSAHSFGLFHMLSLLANDYLAHRVELLEAEEQISEMIRNISMNDNVIGVPEAPGRQTMPSATIASQEISEYHEETMPFTNQANSNEASKTYNYVSLSTQCQPNYTNKDLASGRLMQHIRAEDCHYSEARYDVVDTASTSFICTTPPYTYQGYQ